MLQEALETGKQKWQSMKMAWKSTKELITPNRDVIISKQIQVDTKVSQQTDTSKEKEKSNIRKDSPK